MDDPFLNSRRRWQPPHRPEERKDTQGAYVWALAMILAGVILAVLVWMAS